MTSHPRMCCVPGYVSGYVWHGHACACCPLYSYSDRVCCADSPLSLSLLYQWRHSSKCGVRGACRARSTLRIDYGDARRVRGPTRSRLLKPCQLPPQLRNQKVRQSDSVTMALWDLNGTDDDSDADIDSSSMQQRMYFLEVTRVEFELLL